MRQISILDACQRLAAPVRAAAHTGIKTGGPPPGSSVCRLFTDGARPLGGRSDRHSGSTVDRTGSDRRRRAASRPPGDRRSRSPRTPPLGILSVADYCSNTGAAITALRYVRSGHRRWSRTHPCHLPTARWRPGLLYGMLSPDLFVSHTGNNLL